MQIRKLLLNEKFLSVNSFYLIQGEENIANNKVLFIKYKERTETKLKNKEKRKLLENLIELIQNENYFLNVCKMSLCFSCFSCLLFHRLLFVNNNNNVDKILYQKRLNC